MIDTMITFCESHLLVVGHRHDPTDLAKCFYLNGVSAVVNCKNKIIDNLNEKSPVIENTGTKVRTRSINSTKSTELISQSNLMAFRSITRILKA